MVLSHALGSSTLLPILATIFAVVIMNRRFNAMTMEQSVVVAIGGSLMYDDDVIDDDWIARSADVINSVVATGSKVGIVIGGGHLARHEINQARKSGTTDTFSLDLIGIAATRANAETFVNALRKLGLNVGVGIPTTTEEAAELMTTNQITVMGGTVPGHTTDAVAIRLAKESGASRCVIATNVEFVYDSNPATNPDAKPIPELTLAELQEIVGPAKHDGAGPNVVIDPIGVQVAIDNNIELALVSGRNISDLTGCLMGQRFRGSLVRV